MPKGQLLKRWNDWSAGVGYLVDDGRTPGMYYSSGLLGLQGELRPAPFFNSVTVDIESGRHFQHFVEEPVTAGQTPTLDDSSSKTDTDSTSSSEKKISWTSHTTADNSNRILIIYAGQFDANGSVPTGVTYGGVALTKLTSRELGGDFGNISLWFLKNPATGTGTIEITWSVTRGVQLGIAETWYKVDPSSPFGNDISVAAANNAGPATATVFSASGEIAINVAACGDAVQTMTVVNETQVENITAGDARMATSNEAGAASVALDWTLGSSCDWGEIAVPLRGADPGPSYLYPMHGRKDDGGATVLLQKVSLANNDFGNLETGTHDLTPLTTPGQPARYQGFWWFPIGNDDKPRKLTTVGVGAVSNDTLAATATGFVAGADHLANLNFQLVGIVEDGTNAGGVRILKKDGIPSTNGDWGSVFQVGDKKERAAGLRSLQGATFVMNVEGLFAFNAEGRSRLVFEDFRIWRSTFKNIAIVPWSGGLVLAHPTGLLFYVPGELPFNIGLDANPGTRGLPPSGPTELHGGRYHGVHTAGDIIYSIYQPDLNSTSALVAAGQRQGNLMIWQVLGTTTLQDANHLLGIFLALQGRPVSASHVTPSAWFGNGNDLNYVVLDPRASPFRARADTHKLNTAADAYMSEIRFTEPVDLTEVIIHTSTDMVSGDEFQISLLTNGTGNDIDVGPPCKGAAARHTRAINRAKGGRNVTSLVLHVNWVATSTANRVPPVIQSIELYGTSSIGEVQ